ncbi:MAG: hypothetical protein KF732_06075 [Flavobacteriales bacterium]|nr:hypothetical protein [Flavobacteriales bacterium]
MLNRIGKDLPIKELMVFILSMQLLISPLIAYHYYNNNMEYLMYVDEKPYITFILFFILAFTAGLFLPVIGKKDNTTIRFELSNEDSHGRIGMFLIVFGILFYFLSKFVPSSLRYMFFLLSFSRIVGVFYILFSNIKNKYLIAMLVFGHFAYIIISSALFYELIIWGGFLYMALEIKMQSSFPRKIVFLLLAIVVLVFLQSIKSEYRKQVWDKDKIEHKSNFETFVDVARQTEDVDKKRSRFEHLVTRLNTGWIVSAVMLYVPHFQNFVEGKLLKEDIKSVLLPRFINPDKKKVAGADNNNKFEQFTGRRLGDTTTMRIGVISDAYINFGFFGGALLMFVFGLLLNIFILYLKAKLFHSINYLWVFFIFSFTVRMSDFLVILNSTFKSFIIFLVMTYIIKTFVKQNVDDNSTQTISRSLNKFS